MLAGEVLADMLVDYGVTHLFYVPVISPFVIKQLTARGVVPVVTHGEKAAVYMADGYARVSGRPGICGSQAIGSTNIAAGLRDPFLGRSPVIAMTGRPEAATKLKGLYQDLDDSLAFEPVTKFNTVIDKGDRLPDLVRQAFRAVTTGVPRPAHIGLAGFFGIVTFEEAAASSATEPAFGRVPALRCSPDADAIERAAARLVAAERPIILLGGGVKRSRAEQILSDFVAAHQVPVVTSLNGMGAISDEDPLYLGTAGDYGRDSANRALSEADVLVVVGSSLGSMTTKNWTLIDERATVIQIDVDPAELGRNYPGTVALVGDALTALTALGQHCEFAAPAKWRDRVRELRAEWEASIAEVEADTAVPMRPERLLHELSAALPDDSVLVGDTGHVGAWGARHLRFREGQTFIRAAGSLGWGLPAALGAKCAAPDRPVVCLTGDGGLYYHVAELETACRYGLNVVIVVNNNSGMNQEMFLWEAGTEQEKNWRFADVDLVKVAEGFGCLAQRVDDPADLGDAIRAGLAAGRPVVVDARTDPAAPAPASWGPTT